MKISAHPLVVAAALGLLGPAALMDEEAPHALAGEWSRVEGSPDLPDALGERITMIPFEDSLLLDDGMGTPGTGEWSLEGEGARQVLQRPDTRVVRDFTAQGDLLIVQTTVDIGGIQTRYDAHYARMG